MLSGRRGGEEEKAFSRQETAGERPEKEREGMAKAGKLEK